MLLISVLYRRKTNHLVLWHRKKTFGTSRRVQAPPNPPRAKEGTRTLPYHPQGGHNLQHFCCREGKSFAAFGRTRHRKSLSDGDKGSPEVGELGSAPRPKGGREKRNKERLALKEIPAGRGWIELSDGRGEVSTKLLELVQPWW